MPSDQTVATLSTRGGLPGEPIVHRTDRAILRGLASQVAELAARPIEQEKRELWYRHNALAANTPAGLLRPRERLERDHHAGDLACQGSLARDWEMRLRKEIFWGAQMRDDRVVQPFFNVAHVSTESDWGMHETKIGGEHGGSYVWEAPLKRYDDLARLRFPQITSITRRPQRSLALANEPWATCSTVRLKTSWWWTLGMTQTLVSCAACSR